MKGNGLGNQRSYINVQELGLVDLAPYIPSGVVECDIHEATPH